MRGTPYWFAGDEIGMRNIRFDHIEDYNDIDTINRYKKAKAEGKDPQAVLDEQKETGRDNARTPFQWDRSPEAGFTAGTLSDYAQFLPQGGNLHSGDRYE